jgi:hypothetical protein
MAIGFEALAALVLRHFQAAFLLKVTHGGVRMFGKVAKVPVCSSAVKCFLNFPLNPGATGSDVTSGIFLFPLSPRPFLTKEKEKEERERIKRKEG